MNAQDSRNLERCANALERLADVLELVSDSQSLVALILATRTAFEASDPETPGRT